MLSKAQARGAFQNGEASHMGEFRIQREAYGGPCGEAPGRDMNGYPHMLL